MSLFEDWYNPEWRTAWKYYPCVITLTDADMKRPWKLDWHYMMQKKADVLRRLAKYERARLTGKPQYHHGDPL